MVVEGVLRCSGICGGFVLGGHLVGCALGVDLVGKFVIKQIDELGLVEVLVGFFPNCLFLGGLLIWRISTNILSVRTGWGLLLPRSLLVLLKSDLVVSSLGDTFWAESSCVVGEVMGGVLPCLEICFGGRGVFCRFFSPVTNSGTDMFSIYWLSCGLALSSRRSSTLVSLLVFLEHSLVLASSSLRSLSLSGLNWPWAIMPWAGCSQASWL